jgi:NitT/TauT family transport system substrate-binding protein
MTRVFRLFSTVVLALLGAGLLSSAAAEVSRLRIGAQFGLGYLPLYVARDAGLIDAALKRAGLPPIPVEIRNVAGGPEINDGLLSGSLDVGGGGVTAMILAWDRTRDRGDRAMLGIAALSTLPYVLLTNDASVHSLADLTSRNHIGVPAVRVSVPAVMLSIAAERQFGADQRDRFDPMTVAAAQPDGATALLTHNGLVDGYTLAPPFVQQLAGKPGIHAIWSSADVFGAPTTALAAWTTVRFHRENPKTYAALLAALRDAMALIAADPARAVDIYLKAESSKLPPALIASALASPDLRFGVAPSNVEPVAAFMARAGILRTKPASWKDLFFPELHDEHGG